MPLSPLEQAVLTTIDSHTITEQAAANNISTARVRRIRRSLFDAGLAERHSRPWTRNDDEDLIDALRSGFSLHQCSRRLKRSIAAIRYRAKTMGGIQAIRCGVEATDTISSVRSARQLAELLGVSPRLVIRLCLMKAIRYNRAGYTQPKSKKKNWQFFITDDALMMALDNPVLWPLIPTESITDEYWQLYAEQAPGRITGRWMTTGEVADALGYVPAEIARWCKAGRIKAYTIGTRWHVWSGDVAAMIESKQPPAESNTYQNHTIEHYIALLNNPATTPSDLFGAPSIIQQHLIPPPIEQLVLPYS